ncbi:hypothetical protein [Streptacidiphilus cavernicola]|uniref:Uncharacterized protein n=1 Tax=Streptacidiphilus cavernicola TaxID=3342716 RepID=A0ABV6VXZ7_9ACTN
MLVKKTCPGPCNNAWRKAEETLTLRGTEHSISPAWGQPAQCYTCVGRTLEHLAALPQLLIAVRNEAVEGTPTKLTGTIGRVGLHPAWPGQASRLLIDRIVGEMAELQADILIQRGIWKVGTEPGDGTVAEEDAYIGGIVATLEAHWEWAMQHHPAADEAYDRASANPGSQASTWYRATVYFTKDHEQREVERLAPCPKCRGPWLHESRDLRLVNGEPYIACGDDTCGKLMTKTEYDDYVRAMRKSMERGKAFRKAAA